MNRHDSPDAKRAVRREFQHADISKHLTAAAPALGHAYEELYDRLIDYGAHPNERGTSLSSAMENTEDGGMRFNTIYLHNDEVMLNMALRTTAQVGICVLRIAQIIYPWRTQATGVKFQLETIAQRF